jgi:hypothetical protein
MSLPAYLPVKAVWPRAVSGEELGALFRHRTAHFAMKMLGACDTLKGQNGTRQRPAPTFTEVAVPMLPHAYCTDLRSGVCR